MDRLDKIISGVSAAADLRQNLTTVVHRLSELRVVPTLAVVMVGDNPASKTYVKNKKRSAEEVGINSYDVLLPSTVSHEELLAVIHKLNGDDNVNGILVQLPLPESLDSFSVLAAIDPLKDVDGFHPQNIGRLSYGRSLIYPCTPAGIMHLIKTTGVALPGCNAVVMGRSNIVGKPVAQMLLNDDCSTTIVHSKTRNIAGICAQADILVVAIGRANFVTKDFIKDGAVVIDVGINRSKEGKIVGDVLLDDVMDKVGSITPVPGGVGPMTIAYLLYNTIKLTIEQRGLRDLIALWEY